MHYKRYCLRCFPAVSTQTQQVSVVRVLQSCPAGLTSRLLGCAATVSDSLYKAGHCDLQCSGSTSEILPLAVEVLPNPLHSKTYNRLVCRQCWGPQRCCGFLAVSYSPVSGPSLSAHVFLCPPCPCSPCFSAPRAVLSNPAIIHPEHVSQVTGTCCSRHCGSWALFQKLVVRALLIV